MLVVIVRVIFSTSTWGDREVKIDQMEERILVGDCKELLPFCRELSTLCIND